MSQIKKVPQGLKIVADKNALFYRNQITNKTFVDDAEIIQIMKDEANLGRFMARIKPFPFPGEGQYRQHGEGQYRQYLAYLKPGVDGDDVLSDSVPFTEKRAKLEEEIKAFEACKREVYESSLSPKANDALKAIAKDFPVANPERDPELFRAYYDHTDGRWKLAVIWGFHDSQEKKISEKSIIDKSERLKAKEEKQGSHGVIKLLLAAIVILLLFLAFRKYRQAESQPPQTTDSAQVSPGTENPVEPTETPSDEKGNAPADNPESTASSASAGTAEDSPETKENPTGTAQSATTESQETSAETSSNASEKEQKIQAREAASTTEEKDAEISAESTPQQKPATISTPESQKTDATQQDAVATAEKSETDTSRGKSENASESGNAATQSENASSEKTSESSGNNAQSGSSQNNQAQEKSGTEEQASTEAATATESGEQTTTSAENAQESSSRSEENQSTEDDAESSSAAQNEEARESADTTSDKESGAQSESAKESSAEEQTDGDATQQKGDEIHAEEDASERGNGAQTEKNEDNTGKISTPVPVEKKSFSLSSVGASARVNATAFPDGTMDVEFSIDAYDSRQPKSVELNGTVHAVSDGKLTLSKMPSQESLTFYVVYGDDGVKLPFTVELQ